MIGVKIHSHKGDLDELFREWKDLGVNTVFVVSEELYSQNKFRMLAKNNSIKLFITAQTFMNPEELEKNPSLYAITQQGNKAIEEWAKFVCPTRKEYRKKRIEYFKRIVSKYQPDGLSIDFIRYFVFWENVYPETKPQTLPNTCFCSHCIDSFKKTMNIEIPNDLKETDAIATWILNNYYDSFTYWKCNNITSMLKEMVTAIKKIAPGISINLHALPWRQNDYDGAVKNIAGQDIKALSAYTDYISPMCYTSLLHREPQWISSVTNDIFDYSNNNVIQSIQIKQINPQKEDPYTQQDFKTCLEEALRPPSKGVILFVWDWHSLDNEVDRKQIFKNTIKNVFVE